MAGKKITAKNLEILSELMLIEELACKKCETYAPILGDGELSEQCRTLAGAHRERFEKLYNYLNTHN